MLPRHDGFDIHRYRLGQAVQRPLVVGKDRSLDGACVEVGKGSEAQRQRDGQNNQQLVADAADFHDVAPAVMTRLRPPSLAR